MRALRLLHRHLPDLSIARRRARRPARPHLPDEAGARRRAGHAQHAAAPGPLPDLPQLRNHLPVGCRIRQPGRDRARHRRSAGRAPGQRARSACVVERGTDLAAVRPGPQARPMDAADAARGAQAQGAGRSGRRCAPLAATPAPAQGAAADGLRAAGDGAQHQQRDGACARRRRHPDAGRRRRRLLRRDPLAPERPRRRLERHTAQHRRLVADGVCGQDRGDRDERVGLRRDSASSPKT